MRIFALTISLLLCIYSSHTNAQSAEQLAQAQEQAAASADIPLESYIKSQNSERLLPLRNNGSTDQEITPFGANLFEKNTAARQRATVNPEYLIAPGDKISIQLWGAVDSANVHIVDNQGNIFVPSIGPIQVAGLRAQNLNEAVTARVKQIYTDNVNIYVNLLASTPVGVFVTGNVERPGQYAGSASDSILFYLQQAGGILPARGSYRQIDIIREQAVVASIDLYDFMLSGRLSSHAFKDGDVVLVNPRGPSVVVEGVESTPRSYELNAPQVDGAGVLKLVRPDVDVTHVSITGVRSQQPIARYLTLDSFSNFTVQDGDTLLFNDDLRAQVISVMLAGSYLGPSFYALDNSARLHDLLASVPVEPSQANIDAVYILRESVKQEQKRLLDDALDRLERSIFTAPASSDGEARLRAQEAQLVSEFIERARKIEPLGRVVVAVDGQVANIRLEQGDEVVIPPYSDLVNVAGEVMLPQAIVYQEGRTIEQYIGLAGGFTDRANKATFLLVHANGATTLIDDGGPWFSQNSARALQPGDQILILPKVDSKLMQTVKDITQIIFQIAVAANVATN
ncbi:polysaccharide biosynthesis/export family protein [Glaciecola siphonariae]|uniref:Polysaccharide biosynthesis/export family protein n=1 Tax=Glaciecola siphonariae TaxID=521012 RepID=A0ABV9LUW1_9ALTE